MQNCLTFFGQLTEAQQLQAANELKQRLTPAIRNPSAFLTKIIADVLSGSITGRPTPPSPPQRSPPVPAISKDNLSMQGFTIEFLDYLSPVWQPPLSPVSRHGAMPSASGYAVAHEKRPCT